MVLVKSGKVRSSRACWEGKRAGIVVKVERVLEFAKVKVDPGGSGW